MLEAGVLAYGLTTTFVVSSVNRNRKAARTNAPILDVIGWGLMAFSGATGTILLGYAGLSAAGMPVA